MIQRKQKLQRKKYFTFASYEEFSFFFVFSVEFEKKKPFKKLVEKI